MQKERCEKNNKRGQVTMFIIIAVIVVALIVGYSLLMGKNTVKIDSQFIFAKTSIDQCLSNALLTSIYYTGLSGGYFENVPTPKFSYLGSSMPIYYSAKTNQSSVPSKTEMEKQLVLAVNNSLYMCLTNIDSIKAQGFNLTVGNVKSIKVTILENSVKADIDWPITISKVDKEQIISKFTATTNFDLNTKYNIVNEFITDQKANPESVLLERLGELGITNKFEIETIDIDNNTMLYTFIFTNEKNNDADYIYAFGVEYA